MKSNTEKCRDWRKRHPEQFKQYMKRWREENPDKIKEYNHRQYERRKALRQEQKGSGEDA